MPAASCCVSGCWKSPHSRHRFPNPAINKLLFDKWVILCENKRLQLEMTPQQIYNNGRVCSLHFVPEDFGYNNKLRKGVIPSVNLPDSLQSVIGISIPPTISTELDNPMPSIWGQEHNYAIPSTSSRCSEFQLLDTEQDNATASTSKSHSPMISPAAPKIKVEINEKEESQVCLNPSDNGDSHVISSAEPKIKVEVIKTEESQVCLNLNDNRNHQKDVLNSQNSRQMPKTTLQGSSKQNRTSNKPLILRQVRPFRKFVLKQVNKLPVNQAETVKNIKFTPKASILRTSLLSSLSMGKKCMSTGKKVGESAIVDLTLDEDESAPFSQTPNNAKITVNTEQKSGEKLPVNKQNINNEELNRIDFPCDDNEPQGNINNVANVVENKPENSCVYLTCSRVKNNETRFLEFPKEYNRALTWLALCHRSDILRKNIRELDRFIANTSGLCVDHYNEMCAHMPSIKLEPDNNSNATKDNTTEISLEQFAIKRCDETATVEKVTDTQTEEAATSKESNTTDDNTKLDEIVETYIPVKEYCAFVNCCTHVKDATVRKYRYPKNPDLLRKWVHASGIPDVIDENYLKSLFICGKHFTEDQYTSRGTLQVASVPVPHDLYVDPDAINHQPHWIRKQRFTRKRYMNYPARKMCKLKPRVSSIDCSPDDTSIIANKIAYTSSSKPVAPPILVFKDTNFNSPNTVHQTSTLTRSEPPWPQKCAIKHCQADEESSILFKFPFHRSKLELWIKAVENRAFIPEHLMSAYLMKKICYKHFEKRFQIGEDSLNPDAIPTLDLLDTKNIRTDRATDDNIVWKQSKDGVSDAAVTTRYIKGKVVLYEDSIEFPNFKRKLMFDEGCPRKGLNRFPYNVYRLPQDQSIVHENVKVGHQVQIHSAIIIDDDDESEKRAVDMIWNVIKHNEVCRKKRLKIC